ncbi:glycosyltransferase involved in cell wall biosynthesis [Paraburkholderia youngii]
MVNLEQKRNKTGWLSEYWHPSPEERFCLPSAIYFLVKFRADLAPFDSDRLDDRVTLYFWWEMTARETYPDFDWALRQKDLEYLHQLDNKTLIDQHPDAVTFWLVAAAPSVLDTKQLVETLLEPISWPEMLGPIDAPQSGNIPLPRFLALITTGRPDLRSAFDLTTLTGRLGCLNWWAQHGHLEYKRITWTPPPIGGGLLEPAQPSVNDGPHVPRFLSQIVAERPDLQTAFGSLQTFIGRLDCLSWWLEHGQSQYRTIKWVPPALSASLFEMEWGENPDSFPLPRFLRLIVEERTDLQGFCSLESFIGRIKCLSWWDSDGQHEYRAIKWSAVRLAELLVNLDDEQHADASLLPRFLILIANERADVRSAFDMNTEAGRSQLVSWWNEWARVEFPLLESLKVRRVGSTKEDSDDDEREPARYLARIEGDGYEHGVNVIGFPQGVLGLGEDARMAARVLQLSSTPVTLLNAPMAGPARLEHSVDHLLSDELKYRISLICLPAPEMVRLALEGGRKLIDAPTHKIGAWPWELPHWPSAFGKVHQMVDEIWAQSRFVQSVYSRLGDTPVYQMPMAVEVPTPVQPKRERFGLPTNEFLFYLMFDGNSWLSRKNPLAGVRAFKQAFGNSSPGVGLVIKAMNVRDDDPVWRAVLDLAAGDSRIHIVSERLSRPDSTDFMACCDAYISLHRSEGFGRVIAEAMALGQPVVVTNFSGNVDFCEPDTAFLVDGELVPLRPGDYLFAEGQYWCDPDVSIAAEQLKRMIDDAPLRERIALSGKARIERDYSVEAVARAYARRLNDIVEAKRI